jgi:CRP-like cAMP-binding protein
VSTLSRSPDIKPRLRALTLFAELRPRELNRVAALVDRSRLPAGWRLMKQGQGGFEAFILLEGSAVVDIDGVEVATLGPGDTVGEMALLDALPRCATVTATTEVEVAILTPTALDEMLAIPPVARAVIASMAGRLRRAEGAPEHW